MDKTPKLKAMLKAKCPRCRRGDLFKTSMYGFKSQKMYEVCPNCALRYEVEPGYFYAAMYVGYALNVGLAVCLGMITYFISNELESPWVYVSVILTFSFLLAPVNFRYSRVILMHLLTPKVKYFPHYDHD